MRPSVVRVLADLNVPGLLSLSAILNRVPSSTRRGSGRRLDLRGHADPVLAERRGDPRP